MFKPAIRFMVVSDIHLKDEPTVERERFAKAIKCAYRISKNHENYKNLDAVVMVGDFANKGTRTQMQAAKDILDENVNCSETKVIAQLASHEFMSEGVEAAYEKLSEIFGTEPDVHEVINGFHFVSVTPSKGCNYNDEKKAWVAAELKKAAAHDRKKPIFVFQHPHNTGTVYGSTLWGEDDLISIYMNYPQIIHFSGHSHAPINDPRSIHQQHFTCLGTGTLSYFELDEFDKFCGTVPEHKERAAQMLIVEADSENRVRVYPYDVLTDNYFPYVWKIDAPSDPSTFTYTVDRYKTAVCPYFRENAEISMTRLSGDCCRLEFEQAVIDEDYVDSYDITVRDAEGFTVRHLSIWSEYYFYDMPKTRSVVIDGLDCGGRLNVEVAANGFWNNKSKNKLSLSFEME